MATSNLTDLSLANVQIYQLFASNSKGIGILNMSNQFLWFLKSNFGDNAPLVWCVKLSKWIFFIGFPSLCVLLLRNVSRPTLKDWQNGKACILNLLVLCYSKNESKICSTMKKLFWWFIQSQINIAWWILPNSSSCLRRFMPFIMCHVLIHIDFEKYILQEF